MSTAVLAPLTNALPSGGSRVFIACSHLYGRKFRMHTGKHINMPEEHGEAGVEDEPRIGRRLVEKR